MAGDARTGHADAAGPGSRQTRDAARAGVHFLSSRHGSRRRRRHRRRLYRFVLVG